MALSPSNEASQRANFGAFVIFVTNCFKSSKSPRTRREMAANDSRAAGQLESRYFVAGELLERCASPFILGLLFAEPDSIIAIYQGSGGAMDDIEPIMFRPAGEYHIQPGGNGLVAGRASVVSFNRRELSEILSMYGRHVAAGEWRDYAIDMLRDRAVFSVFRRSTECPLYRIEKAPKLARRQGMYSVIATTGLILKRGHELCRVLGVFEKGRLHVVEV